MSDVEQLQQELAQRKEQLVRECGERVQAILQEYKCGIVATPQIQDGRIVAVVQIVAL